MRMYLGDKKVYAKNSENLIYEVTRLEMYDNTDYMTANLELVAGYDYINHDCSDEQGYVPADRFDESVQDEYELVYFLQESVKESLEDNGYEVLEKLPVIHGVKKEEE